ncbi:hypothetical protein MACH10_28300 [Thalassospira tepidiphila]|nr:hypothetical protein MACH10_28300 [Thalassospira tepidiphila]
MATASAVFTVAVLISGQRQRDRHHQQLREDEKRTRVEELTKSCHARMYALVPKCRLLKALCRQHIATIHNHYAADAQLSESVRSQLLLPEIIKDSDWAAFLETNAEVVGHARLLCTDIQMHNWQISKTSSVAVEAVRRSYIDRLKRIEKSAADVEEFIDNIQNFPEPGVLSNAEL